MKVLHDWDRLEVSGRWARSRGISLLLYALGRKFNFLKRIKFIRENTKAVETEKLAYMETVIKLNTICGVQQIYGIRDLIREKYDKEINALTSKYGIDVRRHIHIGKNSDPKRIRIWIPSLYGQTRESWHFDTKYARGEKVVLGFNERPIFHLDYPYRLALYIDYIFEEMIKCKTQSS
ncbi:hypothetical protein ES702_02129 [subsurface metagenome]